jgi:hypothetical protein
MDDAIGPIAGTILVIMAIVYFIQFIILAALILPLLFLVGRIFSVSSPSATALAW